VSGCSIDPDQFVASVKPLLEATDLEGLHTHLRRNWSNDQIIAMLSCEHRDARKVAALALSLVGGTCCIPAIARHLRDPDPIINQMAEHALWSIWFRSGNPAANAELARGAQHLNTRDFDQALAHFDRALAECPDFAEAYNQRAIAHFLREDYARCKADCQRTVELMPCHFGAWAGLGHCHTYLGDLPAALEAYERALQINPHLDCIREAICEIRKRQNLENRA